MACAIPVLPDSRPQPFDFRDERIAIQSRKVFIHTQSHGPTLVTPTADAAEGSASLVRVRDGALATDVGRHG
jgi:hypothetical protein